MIKTLAFKRRPCFRTATRANGRRRRARSNRDNITITEIDMHAKSINMIRLHFLYYTRTRARFHDVNTFPMSRTIPIALFWSYFLKHSSEVDKLSYSIQFTHNASISTNDIRITFRSSAITRMFHDHSTNILRYTPFCMFSVANPNGIVLK